MSCTEIVIFEVNPDSIPEFIAVRARLLEETKAKFPGLLEATLLHHCSKPGVLIDMWRWENTQSAQAAYAGFRSLPSASALQQLIRGNLYSGHFGPSSIS